MEDTGLDVMNCLRMSDGEARPTSYDKTTCYDCENLSCPYMPEAKVEEFMKGELASMYPNDDVDDIEISSFDRDDD